jgi:alpha-tubulin suppressor-like RCC1 family protein
VITKITISLDNGKVYAWGSNSDGQCGLGDDSEVNQPTQVDIDEPVVQAACGYYHTAFVTGEYTLYTVLFIFSARARFTAH